MARYLMVNADQKIVNAIEWDGNARFTPPEGHILVLEPTRGNPGDIFDGKDVIPAPDVPKIITEFETTIKSIDDDPETVGVFQRFITATRTKLGF